MMNIRRACKKKFIENVKKSSVCMNTEDMYKVNSVLSKLVS